MSDETQGLTYAQAGVDISKADAALARMTEHIKRTHHDYVVGGIGAFSGLFDLGPFLQDREYKDPVLAITTDGAGTLPQVARQALSVVPDGFSTIGWNLAQHCFADLATGGADPAILVDTIDSTDVDPDVHELIIKGMADACYSAGVRLIGGETAQLPGTIIDGETNISATAVGFVERERMIRPHERIKPGAVLIGFASNGIHLNGVSLARKILFEIEGLSVADELPGMGTVGSEMLRKQPNYAATVWGQLNPDTGYLLGAAHITGGGFYDNIARILPKGCRAVINASAWEVPRFFRFLQERGNVTAKEAYRTWNMGIGFVEIIERDWLGRVLRDQLSNHSMAYEIGEIVEGDQEVTINFDK